MAKRSARFTLDGIGGKKDVGNIKQGLDAIPGVLTVAVNQKKGRVTVDFDDTGTGTQQLAGSIQKLGYQVQEAGQSAAD